MATLFSRMRNVVRAHAHEAIDQAEDPQVMAGQIFRDLGDEVQATRRSLVAALAAERHLERQRDNMLREAQEWERKAERLLVANDEPRARSAMERVVTLRAAASSQESPLSTAQRTTQRLRDQITRLKSEWDAARGRVAMINANQAAASAMGTAALATDGYNRAMDRAQRLDKLSCKAATLECEADAAAELLAEQEDLEAAVSAHDKAVEVDAAMRGLRERLSTKNDDTSSS